MELIKITEMSKYFNVSSKTLRYYEQVGLLQSSRLEENRYRYYGGDAIERMKQISILRKMQISIKDIITIFQNRSISDLIETFEKKQSQIENDISALNELRVIVNDFLQNLKQHGINGGNGMQLLYEAAEQHIDTMVTHDKISLDRLERIDEQLSRLSDTDVRIGKIPKMRVVSYKPENMWFDTSPILQWFAERGMYYTPGCKEYFNINDHAVFKVPFDFSNDGIYDDYIFEGGLYAIVSNSMADGNIKKVMLEKWIYESGIFEIDSSRQYMNECTTDFEIMERYMELVDTYIPIKYKENEVYCLCDTDLSEIKITNTETINLNDLVIDKGIESKLIDGELIVKCPSDYNFVKTPMRYKLPLKIDIVGKVDSSNFRIGFGKAQLIFNWEFGYDHLCYGDPYQSLVKLENMTECNGRLQENVYHNISWIMGKEYMAVTVDDDIRFIKKGFPYQRILSESSEVIVKDNIRFCSAFDSVVTVKSVKISEME